TGERVWNSCRTRPVFAGKATCGVRNETSGQRWPSNSAATDGSVHGTSRCLCLPVVAESRQFHTLIILTIILLSPQHAAIGWEAVLGVTHGGSRARRFAGPR